MITSDEQTLRELRAALDRLPLEVECPPQLAQRVIRQQAHHRARATMLLTVVTVGLLALLVPIGSRLATSGSHDDGKPVAGSSQLSRLDLSSLRLPGDGTILPIDSRPAAVRLSGQTVTGEHLDTRAWRDKPGVIFAYASWCAPCRNVLASLTETLRTEGVPAALLTLDTAGGDHSFIDKYRITFPVLNDQDRQVRVASLPQLVVVDTQGRPAAGWTGVREDELSELQTALAQLNLEHASSSTPPAATGQDELVKIGSATARISAIARNTEVVAFGRSAGRQVAIIGVPGLNSALRERLLAALTTDQARWVRLIGVRYTRNQLMAMKDRVDQVFSQLPQDETQHTMTGLDYVRGVIDIYTPRGNTKLIAAVRAVAPSDMLAFHWGGVTFRPN